MGVKRMEKVIRSAVGSVVTGGLILASAAGCAGTRPSSEVGPGVIFNNVIAADIGGELKIVFSDYSRLPATEQPRREDENYMVEVRPAWSPDGKEIAFARTMREEREVILVRSNLGHPDAEATEIGPGVGAPVWSPAGDQIAFLGMSGGEKRAEQEETEPAKEASPAEDEPGSGAQAEPRPAGLTVADTQSGDSRLLVPGEAQPVAWSDEGIFFASGSYGRRDLRLTSPQGKGRRLIYAAAGEGFVGEAALSTDGRWMAIEVVDPKDTSVLVVKDLRGGRAKPVTTSGRVSDMEWSKDSRSVAFVQANDTGDSERVSVWTVGAKRPRALTRRAGNYRSPSWLPDGSTVAYVLDGHIYVQKVRGGPARRLTTGGDASEIASSPM